MDAETTAVTRDEPILERDPSVAQRGSVEFSDTEAEDAFSNLDEFTKDSDLSLDTTKWLPNMVWQDGGAELGMETGKGVVGGLVEAGFQAADLVKYLVNESAAGWVAADPFMSEQAKNAGVEGLEKDANAQLNVPEWLAEPLKTNTHYGQLLNDGTQFLAPYMAGMVITKSLGAVKMAGAALEGLVADGAITQGVSNFVQGAGQSAMAVGTSFITADAKSNLANILYESTKEHDEGLAGALREWAMNEKIEDTDGTLEKRFKNAKIDVAMEALAPLAMEGIKLLAKAGTKTLGKVFQAQKVGEFTSKLAKAKAELEASLPKSKEEALDALFPQRMDPNEAVDPSLPKVEGEMVPAAAKREPTVEVINSSDTMFEAAKKVEKADASVSAAHAANNKKSGLSETLRRVLESKGKLSSTKKMFDSIDASIEAKVKAGEPVDIGEELAKVLPDVPLENLDDYFKAWDHVVTATTTNIRRHVPNDQQKKRAAAALIAGIGDKYSLGGAEGDKLILDSVGKMLKQGADTAAILEELPAQLMKYRFMADHVFDPEIRKLYALRHAAKVEGNKKAAGELLNKVMARQNYKQQLLDTVEQNMSGVGRALQSGKVELTEQDKAWQLALAKYRARNPGTTTTEETYHDVMGAIADEMEKGGQSPEQVSALWKAAQTAWAAAGQLEKGYNYLTKGVYHELWYNHVLGGLRTLESITYGNPAVWGVGRTLSDITGSVWLKDGKVVRQEVFDELEGAMRYLGEGVMSGLAVLTRTDAVKNDVPVSSAKGFFKANMAPLDHTPASPNAISAASLRQAMGWDLEDEAEKAGLGWTAAKMGGWAWDAIGHVVNIPTSRLIPTGDTAFSVTAQRAYIWSTLKGVARRQGITNEAEVKIFAATHMDQVTEDLILSRASNFRKARNTYEPKNGVLDREDLQQLNYRVTNDVDEARLSRPLKLPSGGRVPDNIRDTNPPVASDRTLFRALHHGQAALDSMPMSWITKPFVPFLKTYGNGIQYLADSTPLALASQASRDAAGGAYGPRAQARIIGRSLVGLGLMGAGFAAGVNGMVELPPPNMATAKQNSKREDRQGLQTLNINLGRDSQGHKWKSAIDLSRSSQIVDPFFIAARLGRAGQAVSNGETDQWGAGSAVLASALEIGGTNRLIGGPGRLMMSLVNPTYDTADNVARGLSQVYAPPSALVRNFKNASDPYSRDPGFIAGGGGIAENISNNWKAAAPGFSQEIAPSYGMFGEPRKDANYYGPEVPVYVRAVRSMTPIGLVVTENSPVAKEMLKFQMQGKAFTPLAKREALELPEANRTGQAVKLPLDQYTSVDDYGRTITLWDKYNSLFQNEPELDMKKAGYGKRTLYESMNEMIESPEYKAAAGGNAVVNIGGKRTFLSGSQWNMLWAKYNQHKEMTKKILTEFIRSPQGKNFRNKEGDTIQDTLRGVSDQFSAPEASQVPTDNNMVTEVIGSNG